MTGWTKEWPTEPGNYWLYGWCSCRRDGPAKFHYVKVWEIMNGLCYTTEGYFLDESAWGLWCEAELPEPPEESHGIL